MAFLCIVNLIIGVIIMHIDEYNIENGCKRLSFGLESELLIGACYEKLSNDEMYFTLGEGLFGTDNEGLRASMVVFMELLMRRHCEVNKGKKVLNLKSLNVDYIATPPSNFVRGITGVVHQTQDIYFMKGLLHSQDCLVMSGTAVWSFTP